MSEFVDYYELLQSEAMVRPEHSGIERRSGECPHPLGIHELPGDNSRWNLIAHNANSIPARKWRSLRISG